MGSLRDALIEKYKSVAQDSQQGFHFHIGRRLTQLVGYSGELLEVIPESSIAALAGTGNPLCLGPIATRENVVYVGNGAGIDSLIATRMTSPAGKVVDVDTTTEMQERAIIGLRKPGWATWSLRTATLNPFLRAMDGPT